MPAAGAGTTRDVEPIPETVAAVEEYGPFLPGHGDLLVQLNRMADRVRAVVPDCVGMSLALNQSGVTFTLVATAEEIAALDGVQYLSDGPCETAVEEGRVLEFREQDVLREASWQLFAQATASSGIASTLTLPVVVEGRIGGSVNLYAAGPDSFSGHHGAVADIFHAWAPGAVANADLSFATRRIAEQAPEILHDEVRVQVALGIIAASEGIDMQAARDRLRDAAERAGISEQAVARQIIGELRDAGEPTVVERRCMRLSAACPEHCTGGLG
jgi:hypothetical protein